MRIAEHVFHNLFKGDVNPTLPAMPMPPKKKKGYGGFLAIIVAVIATAALQCPTDSSDCHACGVIIKGF